MHAEVFGGVRPVATMVEVSALIAADLYVEIEVDAYVVRTEPTAAKRPSASGQVRRDTGHSRDGQRPVQMREASSTSGSVGTPGSHRTGAPSESGSSRSSDHVVAARVQPVGGQMHLLGRRKMHEAVARPATAAGARPRRSRRPTPRSVQRWSSSRGDGIMPPVCPCRNFGDA